MRLNLSGSRRLDRVLRTPISTTSVYDIVADRWDEAVSLWLDGKI